MMNSSLLIWTLLLLVPLISTRQVLSQSYTFDIHRTKKVISQTRIEPAHNWENQAMVILAYDDKGRRTGIRNYEVSNSIGNSWNIISEDHFEYNSKNLITFSSYKYWNSNTGLLGHKFWHERDYLDDLILEKRDYYRNFQNDYFEKTTWSYRYNQNQQIIDIVYNWSNNEGNKLGSRTRKYWSEQGCLKSVVNYLLLDDKWTEIDSIANTTDGNCLIELRNRYVSNQGLWIWVHGQKFERLFDDFDNITKEFEYIGTDQNPSWVLKTDCTIEYDPSGNLVRFNQFIWPLDSLIHNVWFNYDEEGRLIHETWEHINTSKGQVMLTGVYTVIFDSFGNKVKTEFYVERDTLSSQYLSRELEYDIHNNINRVLNISEFYNHDQEGKKHSNEETEEVLISYDCDNKLKSSLYITSKIIDGLAVLVPQQLFSFEYYLSTNCIPDSNLESELTFFPNPASNYVQIYYPEHLGNTQLRIIDSMGRVIFEDQLELSNYFSIDLKSILNGNYILTLDNGTLSVSKQLVIAK